MAVVRMTLALMAILTVARMSQACLCGLRHPQENFCVADFVLSVNVIEMEEIYGNSLPRHQFPLEVKYTVDISFVFKWSDESNISDQIYLFTGGSEASCRQDLEVGNSYVVMGYVYDGKMYFGQCDWTTRNEDLTEHMIRGLRFKYRRGCNCKIQTCYGDQHCDSLGNQNNTCLWMSSNECDRQFGFCTERPDIGCAWRRNGMRRNCLRGLTYA